MIEANGRKPSQEKYAAFHAGVPGGGSTGERPDYRIDQIGNQLGVRPEFLQNPRIREYLWYHNEFGNYRQELQSTITHLKTPSAPLDLSQELRERLAGNLERATIILDLAQSITEEGAGVRTITPEYLQEKLNPFLNRYGLYVEQLSLDEVETLDVRLTEQNIIGLLDQYEGRFADYRFVSAEREAERAHFDYGDRQRGDFYKEQVYRTLEKQTFYYYAQHTENYQAHEQVTTSNMGFTDADTERHEHLHILSNLLTDLLAENPAAIAIINPETLMHTSWGKGSLNHILSKYGLHIDILPELGEPLNIAQIYMQQAREKTRKDQTEQA